MKRGRPRHDDILTPREWEVLALLREGLTNEQIAGRLGISRNTTKFHLAEIFSKIGVKDREAASRWQSEHTRRQGFGALGIYSARGLSFLVPSKPAVAALSVVTVLGLSLAGLLSVGSLPKFDLDGLLSSGQAPATSGSSSPARPLVHITGVQSSAFSTVVEFDLYVPRALGGDEVAHVSEAVLQFSREGAQVNGQVVSQRLMPEGAGLHVAVEFPAPIQAEDFTLSIGELTVVPNGGDGRAIARGLRSSARTSDFPVAAPFAVDSAAGMRIDTGYGWSYVIDAVEFDATAVRVTYHVEGDIDGLVALPPQAGDDAIGIPFPQDGTSGAVLVPAGRADHVRLVFEPAGRPIDKEVSLRLFRSSAGLWNARDLTSLVPDAAGLSVEEGEYVSIRLTAPTAYTGRGAPGNNATLTDNLGNAYRLYHGSGSMPPRHSQWDFVGPLPVGVSELSLTLPGYLAIEEGSWELLVELR